MNSMDKDTTVATGVNTMAISAQTKHSKNTLEAASKALSVALNNIPLEIKAGYLQILTELVESSVAQFKSDEKKALKSTLGSFFMEGE